MQFYHHRFLVVGWKLVYLVDHSVNVIAGLFAIFFIWKDRQMEAFLRQVFSSSTCNSFSTKGSICMRVTARSVAPPSSSLLDRRSFIVGSRTSREPLCNMAASFHTINLQLFKRLSPIRIVCVIASGILLMEDIQWRLKCRMCSRKV